MKGKKKVGRRKEKEKAIPERELYKTTATKHVSANHCCFQGKAVACNPEKFLTFIFVYIYKYICTTKSHLTYN